MKINHCQYNHPFKGNKWKKRLNHLKTFMAVNLGDVHFHAIDDFVWCFIATQSEHLLATVMSELRVQFDFEGSLVFTTTDILLTSWLQSL